ncbi:MAG: sulfotransferase domain-containing protein [Alphaproteobacteria bacterium]|nr:sulfotransferase domain-containing protein [Alphaproteobacteria bacterium]
MSAKMPEPDGPAGSGGIYWLSSYPKSGNTWFRTFLRNYMTDGDKPVDINELHTGAIASARSWLDHELGFDTADLLPGEIEMVRPHVYDWSVNHETLEYHKIHDAYTFLPDGQPLVGRVATRGALYFVRNPLDVAPSFANHLQCSIDEAIDNMAKPEMTFAGSRKRLNNQTAQRLLTWSDHVRSWIDASGLRIEVLRYEDMQATPELSFARAVKFLELPEDEARLTKAIAFSKFERVKQQEQERGFREKPPNTPAFFRQGKSGGWRQELTEAQVARIIADHGAVMHRLGYLDAAGNPV